MLNSDMTSRDGQPARPWLLYGAYGYTGELIAREAVRQGRRPVLAGRNAARVSALAAELGCEHRIFSLADRGEVVRGLEGISAVLHCAGPFMTTGRQMVEACMEAGVAYADISGEIPVLEDMYTRHDEALAAGIPVVPGSGFDVLPTDCLALTLKEELPDATRLRLAMAGKPTLSRGTWRSTLEAVPRCGSVRREGKLITVPHAWQAETIRFDDQPRYAMTLPWGDVSSAWRSTGIPDISVYAAMTRVTVASMRLIRGVVCPLLRVRWVLQLLLKGASRFITGPSQKHRDTEIMHIRGDAWNDRGQQVTRFLHTPEGYTSTVHASIAVVDALAQGRIAPGVWTPAQAMGSGFAVTLPGMRWVQPSENGLDP